MARALPISSFLSALIVMTTLLVGCGGDEVESLAPAADSASESPADIATADAADPLLPDAPWFEIPEDWEEDHPRLSPNAKLDAHFIGLAEREMPRAAGDGGGRAWLESIEPLEGELGDVAWHRDADHASPPIVRAGSVQRIGFRFEVGPEGIDEGGLVFVLADPFWSWSEAQTVEPNAFGYTTAVLREGGAELEPGGRGAEFVVRGRALAPGEQIDFVLGAGPLGVRVDEYAEHGSEILVAVDADGDGTRRWIEDSVRLDVVGRRGVRLVAFGPADVAPSETIEVSLAILDSNANRTLWPEYSWDSDGLAEGRFSVEWLGRADDSDFALPESFESRAAPDAPHRLRFVTPDHEGTLRMVIRGQGKLEGLDAVVNPIVVRRSPRRLVWADLHGHSRLSDGTGSPNDYFSYARDVARLDVIALTDHDHWGVRPLDTYPELAERIRETASLFDEPGRFVTIPGYEWTNWLHGHRHVLYFGGDPDDPSPIFSAIDPATDRPDELWDALRGRRALTFAHHSAGEPVATNWYYAPDPELEPLTEVSSVHGMSEAADAPLPVRGGIPGNFVRDALEFGYRLGFVGSGDSHDGHPGLAHLVTGQGGLAGIVTEALDRPSLYAAMKARRTMATNGIRPWMEVSIDETPMGGTLEAAVGEQTLRIRYEATEPVERIDLVRSGRVARIDGEGRLTLDLVRTIPALGPGEFHYVRIIERNDGVAWSSPIFVDVPSGESETAEPN